MKKVVISFTICLAAILLLTNSGCSLPFNQNNSNNQNTVSPTISQTTKSVQTVTLPDNTALGGTQTTITANPDIPLIPGPRIDLNPDQIAILKWYDANTTGVLYFMQGVPSAQSIGVDNNPYALCYDGSEIWSTSMNFNSITHFSAHGVFDRSALDIFSTDAQPIAACYDGINIWVACRGTNIVQRLNLSTRNGVTKAFEVNRYAAGAGSAATGGTNAGKGLSAICFDGTYVWVTNDANNTLVKLNMWSVDVYQAVGPLPTYSYAIEECNGPQGICFDGVDLWITNSLGNSVSRIDPATGACSGTFAVGQSPKGICFDGSNIWVVNKGGATITKMRTNGIKVGTYAVPAGPQEICYDGAYIWVTSPGSNKVTKLKAEDGTLVGSFEVPNPIGICFDGVNIWVAQGSDSYIRKM